MLLTVAVTKSGQYIARLLYVIATTGYFLLPHVSKRTFLDENAFVLEGSVPKISAAKFTTVAAQFNHVNDVHGLRVAVQQSVGKLGLEISEQELHVEGQTTACKNIHVVVRSTRGDGKESVVLMTPLHASFGLSGRQLGRDSLTLLAGNAITQYVASVRWLAKDFIWLIPDTRCGILKSAKAWVDEYCGVSQCVVNGSRGLMRAGVMAAAVVLEGGHGGEEAEVQLAVEGYDGLLPKLDLLYVVKSQVERFVHLPLSLGEPMAGWRAAWQQALPAQWSVWVGMWLSGAQFIVGSALGFPTGAHAAFKAYGVDALTLRLVTQREVGGGVSDSALLQQLCMCLESILRSLNNLQERMHHSSSFYLLYSPHVFVSIAQYILLPICALLAVAGQVMISKSLVKSSGTSRHAVLDDISGWLMPCALVSVVYGCCWTTGYAARLIMCPKEGCGVTSVLSSNLPLTLTLTLGATLCTLVATPLLLRTVPNTHATRSGSWRLYTQPCRLMARLPVVYGSVFLVQAVALLCLNWCAAYVNLLLITPLLLATPHTSGMPPLHSAVGAPVARPKPSQQPRGDDTDGRKGAQVAHPKPCEEVENDDKGQSSAGGVQQDGGGCVGVASPGPHTGAVASAQDGVGRGGEAAQPVLRMVAWVQRCVLCVYMGVTCPLVWLLVVWGARGWSGLRHVVCALTPLSWFVVTGMYFPAWVCAAFVLSMSGFASRRVVL